MRAHLAQTSNVLCLELAEKRKTSRLGFIPALPHRDPPQQLDPQAPSTSHNTLPTPTDNQSPLPEEGGSQLPDDNLLHTPRDEDAWVDDSEESEESDDDLDNTSESSRRGWEPPVSNNGDNMSISSDNGDISLPPYVPPEDLRQRTWVAPKVINFPNPRAGEPVGSVDPTNNTYASLLGNSSDQNPYRPFASKLDWEVAKWAKLQGPSSTSLMDLLKIEGVRPFHSDGRSTQFLILSHCRSMNNLVSHTRPHANSIASLIAFLVRGSSNERRWSWLGRHLTCTFGTSSPASRTSLGSPSSHLL